MRIFMTDIPKMLELSRVEQERLLMVSCYDHFIKEVTFYKGLDDVKVPNDKFIVLVDNEEFYVHLSQLNRTVYHCKKHSAENEIKRMLKLELSPKLKF